ncbi:death-on-curing protein [Propionibacteriaceae bacterium ES.041]|nr:death-on-curing protein [Propionibacteriaceae bacterium ES.041]
MTELLDTEDLLRLVGDLGVGPMRDLGLLESAAARPRTSLFGEDAYPDLTTKAAVLLESLVRNHPLVDGNKRLGWTATLVFLDLNDHWIEVIDDDGYDLVIGVAEGRIAPAETAELLLRWKGERPPD